MRHYCTLFDSKYLPQGLALYESLKKHSREPFELHILAMDLGLDLALTLTDLRIPNFMTLGALESYEYRLEDVRLSRSWQEHCWTMASVWSLYLMECFGLKEITYLDADLMFFNDPAPVFAEIGARSIAITPHQFPNNAQKQRLQASGLFNVGFVHFKNTSAGSACLSEWAHQVRERCSANYGCGDQLYLDAWPKKYGDEVCILGHGINTGPWNLMAYDLNERNGSLYLGGHPLVCYHYHEYKHGERLTNYPLRPVDLALIYAPYIQAVENAKQRIEAIHLPA